MPDRLNRLTSGLGASRPAPQTGGNLTGRTFLGKYTVLNQLGEGAMGRVFLARRTLDLRKVVVKVMHPEVASQPKFVELFEREMGVMAQFQHPNVVALYDSSTKDALGPCIVMEYVPGTDLEHILAKERRLDPARLGRLLGQLCSALQAAHDNGIVHRDLKPANLMLMDAGTPEEILKVMDFGLAKLSAAPHIRLEKLKGDDRDVATGTPEYMSSEQARGAEVDHRADLYSVGVILYELLTGTLPFVRKSIPELLQAHVEDPPPPFNKVGAGGLVPSAVESVVLWCLSKFPNERPQTAWELALKYEKAVGQKVLAGIQPPAPPTSRPAVAALAPKKPVDPNATVYSLEAWMPEAIAVIKLRGFVEDAHGEVLASEPGVVKVKLGQADCKYRVGPPPPPPKKGWFGTVSAAPPAPANPIDMELQMTKPPGAQNLSITVVIKPGRGSTIRRTSPDWHRCCELIFRDLKAYFMSK